MPTTEGEFTLGDLYEEISETLAKARLMCLRQQKQEARKLLLQAEREYQRFKDVLTGYPGVLALEYALETTRTTIEASDQPVPISHARGKRRRVSVVK